MCFQFACGSFCGYFFKKNFKCVFLKLKLQLICLEIFTESNLGLLQRLDHLLFLYLPLDAFNISVCSMLTSMSHFSLYFSKLCNAPGISIFDSVISTSSAYISISSLPMQGAWVAFPNLGCYMREIKIFTILTSSEKSKFLIHPQVVYISQRKCARQYEYASVLNTHFAEVSLGGT